MENAESNRPASGRPRWETTVTAAPAARACSEGRDGSPDAGRVGDLPTREGDVQVRADQHPPAREVEVGHARDRGASPHLSPGSVARARRNAAGTEHGDLLAPKTEPPAGGRNESTETNTSTRVISRWEECKAFLPPGRVWGEGRTRFGPPAKPFLGLDPSPPAPLPRAGGEWPLLQAFMNATVVSSIRLEKPHSLS